MSLTHRAGYTTATRLRRVATALAMMVCLVLGAFLFTRVGQSATDSPVVIGLVRWMANLTERGSPATPDAASAAPARVARVAYLGSFSADWPAPRGTPWIRVVEQEFERQGYVVGQNLEIISRFGESDFDRMPQLAEELVSLAPDVIILADSAANSPGRRATEQIPLIQVISTDPERSGLVPRLNQPDGNVTGQTINSLESTAKRLRLLKSLIPELTDLGVLWRENRSQQIEWDYLQEAANQIEREGGQRVTLHSLPFRDPSDLGEILLGAGQVQAIVVLGAPAINAYSQEIADVARQRRIPLMGDNVTWVQAGAMASYAPNYEELYRRATAQAVRLLRGARVADVPFELPRCFDFAVNRQTLHALDRDLGPDIREQVTIAFGGPQPAVGRCTDR